MDNGGRHRYREQLTRVRKIIATTGTEFVGVAVGALSGFIIVHYLSKGMYAQYTFIIACISFAAGLSDLGLSHCYLPVVGSRANDVGWVLKCCDRIYSARRLLYVSAAIVVVPYFAISSYRHGWLDAPFVGAALFGVLLVGFSVREQVYRQTLIILREISIVNRVSLRNSGLRLTLTAIVVAVTNNSLILPAIFASALAVSFYSLWAFKRQPALHGFGDLHLDLDEQHQVDATVRRIVRPLIIPNLFYQFQGTISIFLVAIFASSNSLAEVGALGRPALILVVVDRVTGALFFPFIARSVEGVELRRFMFRAHAFYLLCMAILFTSALLVPDFWIWLIGSRYTDQKQLLWIVFLAAILMNASGFAGTSLTSRGKTQGQLFLIPLVLISQAIYLYCFGVHDTLTSLQFSVATASVFFIYEYCLLWYLILRTSP